MDTPSQAASYPVVVEGDPLTKIEELESTAIIEAVKGKVSDTWVYHFRQGGEELWGLSVVGVEQASREMATRGEALRIIDVHIEHEDDREARFVATAGRYGIGQNGAQVLLDTQTRAKRQPKYIRLRSGGEQFNEHWYEVGVSKVTRNAKAALLADDVRTSIIAEAKQLGNRRVREVAPERSKAEEGQPSPAASSNGEPIDHRQVRAIEHLLQQRYPDEQERVLWLEQVMPDAVKGTNAQVGVLTKAQGAELIRLLQEAEP